MAEPLSTQPIPVREHVARILDTIEPLGVYGQTLLDAGGLPIAEDVTSPMQLPPFDNSAMDGYAVAFHDVADAAEDHHIHLPVVGEIGAGQARLVALSPGTAVKIMTGAPVPHGADAVVPYEWTDRGVAQVQITRAPREGEHIRRAGEDVETGEVLVSEGTVLGPRHIGLLAAAGRAEVQARPRPRVVVMSTGTELRDPGATLAPDSIYDSNSFMLAAAVREAGGIPFRVGAVPDDAAGFTEALQDQLVRADMVITSGGVSEGDYDVVKEALRDTGSMWFGKVAMQPGKPQGFGLVGDDEVPIFTLPGNPVSAYISFQVFVLPALRKLQGRTPYERPTRTARLTHGLSSPEGRQQFVRADYDARVVTPVGGHGSHLLGDLAASNALINVPADVTSLKPGDSVEVLLLDEAF
ncbi:gephyrin-like molybdotransferase Glp [Nocardioides sp. Root151]|uniref:molybdotransferase-like divisome protein Glp n=1 Tax=Nocardioides sp. Root151 TaxID=1736475 RepID=UPI000702A928|nr:gephyrin-like molybdotransferase Glp [Nocardioides sp. Root151]KQZ67011.1 molybdopterin biosynthesis protein MoeA [Nocardioides sp. Root151]